MFVFCLHGRYTMIFVFPILYLGWKVIKGTKFLKPTEVNLRPADLDQIEEYHNNFVPAKADSMFERVLDKLFS